MGNTTWILGRAALAGTLDTALVWSWALVLGTFVVVTAVADWQQGHLLLRINAQYRRKIVHGTTKISPQVLQRLGSGQLLGRVFEAGAVDTLAVNAGLGSLTAAVDIAFTAGLFLMIPGARIVALVFALWIGLVLTMAVRLYRLQRAWTVERIAMSETVVENLQGRRTRIVQSAPESIHAGDDRHLERYLRVSAAVDRAEASFEAVAARGWLVVALLALAGC